MESKRRSILKSLSWRITASITTLIIVYLTTGQLVFAGSIALLEVFVKMAIYYFHERIWVHVKI